MDDTETQITRKLLDFSLEMAGTTGANTVLVYAEVFASEEGLREFLDRAGDTRIVLVAREHEPDLRELPTEVVKVPDIKLTRVGQIKVAILLGLARGLFSEGETLVCLTGMAETNRVDGLLFMEIEKPRPIGPETLPKREFFGKGEEGVDYEAHHERAQE